jgi:amidase
MSKINSVDSSGAFCQVIEIEPHQQGCLTGLSFAVKDMIDVAGCQTRVGNPDWARTHPQAVAHAIVVDQCLSAGAVCRGKTNMDELAFSLMGNNHFYGTPLNSKASNRVPGGSSSGSASAVACGLVDFALGTDTGGSVRVPAANCGIFGLRPSHGLLSVAGVTPASPSFDTVGLFTANIDVMANVATTLLGLTNESRDMADLESIYVVRDLFDMCDTAVRHASFKAIDRIKSAFPTKVKFISSNQIRDTSDGYTFDIHHCGDIFWRIELAEMWSCLGAWIEGDQPQMGPVTKGNFEIAKSVDRNKMAQACQARWRLAQLINQFLGSNKLLCLPVAPALAPIKTEVKNIEDQKKSTYYPNALALNAISGVACTPQMSLPLSEFDGVPVGVSFMAAQHHDNLLLHACNHICKVMDLK